MKLKKSDIFLLPSLIGVFIIYIIPFVIVIRFSLIDNPISQKFIFLDNYTSLVDNEAFRLSAYNTFRFSIVAVPLLVVLSLVFAILLDSKARTSSFFRTCFLSPVMVPVASVVLVWQSLFNLNGLLGKMFNIDWLKSDYAWLVIVVLFVWKNIGFNIVIFITALESVPLELIEAIELDGASSFYAFFKIKLRYIFSSIAFVTIMSVINSFKVFRETYLLAGNYPYESLYLLQTFMNNVFKNVDYQKLSSAAILMSMVMIIIISLLCMVQSRIEKDID